MPHSYRGHSIHGTGLVGGGGGGGFRASNHSATVNKVINQSIFLLIIGGRIHLLILVYKLAAGTTQMESLTSL